jgi:hypothetical protein
MIKFLTGWASFLKKTVLPLQCFANCYLKANGVVNFANGHFGTDYINFNQYDQMQSNGSINGTALGAFLVKSQSSDYWKNMIPQFAHFCTNFFASEAA